LQLFQEINDIKALLRIYSSIKDQIIKTPCIYCDFLSTKYDHEIYLKLENLQKTGAFKIRGNSYKISKFPADKLAGGVITASSGNHGLGLSLAASLKSVRARIIVPEKTPENKIEKIKKYGAEIEIRGSNYDQAVDYARSTAAEEGLIYIPSFDDPEIIKGNSTLGLEMLTQVDKPGAVLTPIGGGGGISGICLAREIISPETKVIGVEAAGAASMLISTEKGRRIRLKEVNTLADGIKVAEPGELTFEIVKNKVSEIITISEEELFKAFKILLKEAKIVAELAGCASTAALEKIDFKTIEGPIVLLISGGNIDSSLIMEILG